MTTALRLRLLFSLGLGFLLLGLLKYRFPILGDLFIRTEAIYCIFTVREVSDVIDNVMTKSVLVLGGRWDILGSSCVFAGTFALLVLSLWLAEEILMRKLNGGARQILNGVAGILETGCVFLISRIQFSDSVSIILAGMVLLIYMMNVLLREEAWRDVEFVRRSVDSLLMMLFLVAELLFLPLYLSRVGLIRNSRVGKTFALFYGAILLFSSAVLATPLPSNAYSELTSLGGREIYDLKLSRGSSKLFFYSSDKPEMCGDHDYEGSTSPLWDRIESIDIKDRKPSFQTIYEGRSLSQFLELNENDREIYFIDRDQRLLFVVDINNNRIKNAVVLESFNGDGNARLAGGAEALYVLSDAYPQFIYKVDVRGRRITGQRQVDSVNANLLFNKDRHVLYAVDYCPTTKNKDGLNVFSISEFDGETLALLRRIPLAGIGNFALSGDGHKLFCLDHGFIGNSWLYTLDTQTLSPIEKAPIFPGSREITIDEGRGLVFVGNAFTGLIDLIDWKTGKVIATYRAGRYSLREIVLDEDRRTFYVSTQYFGLFRGTY